MYQVEFDSTKVSDASKLWELPNIFKGYQQVTSSIPYDFKTIPKEIKFSSDQKYDDIDKIRDNLRMNEFDHLNFDPTIKS